ncbi:MAG: ATP-binding protein [Candidatus Omnitrophica bacterium]|nr:ATP-binding protein [Candidatus Omnitrophota bacterium]
MHTLINRTLTSSIIEKLKANPVVAILGPRQCGKSTLANIIAPTQKNMIFLDLERPSDLNRLNEPELFFSHNKEALIVLDEIQRVPNLFPIIRSTVDTNHRHGQFLILGSASEKLIRQSSESLAGRIAYIELTPFLFNEATRVPFLKDPLNTLWLRGGFPRSLLAKTDHESFEWRLNFIRTFLEQDISNLGIKIPAEHLSRFWRMFAHLNGQLLNSAKLAGSLGISSHTVRHYIDILRHTFMLRVLEPYSTNNKKRLVKSPKVFLRDSGLLNALLDIESANDLFAHPTFGSSWEGFVIEQILSLSPRFKACFYRNSNGNEIDLILQYKQKRVAIECKSSLTPQIRPGLMVALDELSIDQAWIIAPVEPGSSYPLSKRVTVSSLAKCIEFLNQSFL